LASLYEVGFLVEQIGLRGLKTRLRRRQAGLFGQQLRLKRSRIDLRPATVLA
jgi:hypothetical protein